ncbi:MAG: AAA family ATPase [Phycisphaerae bacterium]|nr:AAA family ATPase [Phycisphaerae bacterium]
MLIEFRVKNFLSFRDEQVLSMVASKDTSLEGNCFNASEHRLLKAAAIYGPNASGKSNLIKAVDFMRRLVEKSAEKQPGKGFRISPFLLDEKSAQKPSLFEVTFLLKGIRYQYGFTVTRERVHDEWLIAYPKGKPQRWFDRKKEKTDWKWSSFLKGERERLKKLTRPDALFLSVAAQFDHEQLTPIYEWFMNSLRILPDKDSLRQVTAEILTSPNLGESTRRAFRNVILAFLQDADLGITGFDVKKRDIAEANLPKNVPEEVKTQVLRRLKEYPIYDVKMSHRNHEMGRDVSFDFQDESDGTQRFFELVGHWMGVASQGGSMFVDELEASLHPLLTRKLIEFFQDPNINIKNAQLIFATHDTTLLDPELFRRDQIWFTEKDKKGTSRLYSLWDYTPRKGEAMQKGYLAGRYGAVPILGRFDIK